MTKKLLFILAITFAFSAKAQNIPNAGFESWAPGFGYEDPNSWGTLNALGLLGVPVSVTKSTSRHSGAFSAKVETILADLEMSGTPEPFPGILFIGSLNVLSQSAVFGTPFTAKPDSLVGWIKYSPVNDDACGVVVQLSKWDAVNMTQEFIGFGIYSSSSPSSSFYRFSVPIDYESQSTPDTLQVTVVSSAEEGQGQVGSAVWIDDLSLIYNTSSIGELNGSSFEVFPNPVIDELSISSKTVDKMEVYSATGILIDHIVIDPGATYIYDTKKIANGLYLVKNSKGELKRFIVQH
jgi:hypothetical protein